MSKTHGTLRCKINQFYTVVCRLANTLTVYFEIQIKSILFTYFIWMLSNMPQYPTYTEDTPPIRVLSDFSPQKRLLHNGREVGR